MADVLSAIGFTPCGCGCRDPQAEPGCPCPECQPGPGIDHGARRNNLVSVRRSRLRELLKEGDHRTLTEDEEEELESLLHLYLHREA